MTGRVVHFEIPFDDAGRAKAFYREVFGWTMRDMPGWDYVTVSSGPTREDGSATEPGYIGGGMTARTGVNGTTVITIDTDDADATLATVAAHGGEVLQDKMPVGDLGFAAYFRDPEGNVVGLWQDAGRTAG
ncbi:VOC family protein [Georgenia sp. SUBG003]|uniref:VOC family protein n=1 Tax=Georgenia sp. SUBG003 TaxID=1497974 RepID=UPI0004D7442C|nr:glyoxalase [Georgenia sp. SUBG003]